MMLNGKSLFIFLEDAGGVGGGGGRSWERGLHDTNNKNSL